MTRAGREAARGECKQLRQRPHRPVGPGGTMAARICEPVPIAWAFLSRGTFPVAGLHCKCSRHSGGRGGGAEGRQGGASPEAYAKTKTGGHPQGDRPPLPPVARAMSLLTLPTPPGPRGPALPRPRYRPRDATLHPDCDPSAPGGAVRACLAPARLLTRPAPAQGAQQPEGRKEERQGGRHGHGPVNIAHVRAAEAVIQAAYLAGVAVRK